MNYTIEVNTGLGNAPLFVVRHCPDSRGFGLVIGTGCTMQQACTIITLHYAPIADLERLAAIPDTRGKNEN